AFVNIPALMARPSAAITTIVRKRFIACYLLQTLKEHPFFLPAAPHAQIPAHTSLSINCRQIGLCYNPPRQFIRERKMNGQELINAPALFNSTSLGKEHTKWGRDTLGPLEDAKPRLSSIMSGEKLK
ncbi:MAG: hypothetical protein ACYSTG_09440, partial [Planctomycetota bacterium]